MNDREFKKHLHAMARGEEAGGTEGPVLGQTKSAQ